MPAICIAPRGRLGCEIFMLIQPQRVVASSYTSAVMVDIEMYHVLPEEGKTPEYLGY